MNPCIFAIVRLGYVLYPLHSLFVHINVFFQELLMFLVLPHQSFARAGAELFILSVVSGNALCPSQY